MKATTISSVLIALFFSFGAYAGDGHAHKSKKDNSAHSKEHKCEKCKKSEKDCTCDDKHNDHEGEHKEEEKK